MNSKMSYPIITKGLRHNNRVRPSRFKIIRNLRGFGGDILDCLSFFDWITSPKLVGIKEFQIQNSGNILGWAIFAVFVNKESDSFEVDDVTSALLERFDRVLIINNGNKILNFNSNRVISVNKKNLGRDLSSYSLGVEMIDLHSTSEILFLNDSVYYQSKFKLRRILKSLSSKSEEVTALTVSNQGQLHFQTFFFYFPKARTVDAKVLLDLRSARTKRALVKFGEINLSRRLIKKGIAVKPVFCNLELAEATKRSKINSEKEIDYLDFLVRHRVALNPSMHFAPGLFELSGIIKKSIFIKNPIGYDKSTLNRLMKIVFH